MSQPQKQYVIDATALLALSKEAASNIIWDTVISLLESGRLFVPVLVWEEVKDIDPETFSRISPFGQARLPSSDKVWKTAVTYSEKYTASMFSKSYNESDYWVVAEAKLGTLVVVVANPVGDRVRKLCKQTGASWVTLKELVAAEGAKED